MIRAGILAVACSLLVGCGGNVFKVDSRFTLEEEQKLQAASDAWQAAGAEPFYFVWREHVTETTPGHTIVRSTGRAAAMTREAFRDEHHIAHTYNFDGIDVQIMFAMDRLDETRPGVNLQATATHEFGHVLLHGGDEVHIARDEAIMNPSPVVDAISVFDVAALRARQ